jgi:hypothetical protein
MTGLAIGAAVALVVLAVAGGIRRARAQQAAKERQLVQNGFRPCDGDSRQLTAVVRTLHDSTEVEVCKPWKRDGADAAIYWYEVSTPSSDEHPRVAADEFLCRIQRTSRQPFVLYLAPVKLAPGLGTKLLEGVLAMSAPPSLHKLEVPQPLRSRGVLAAYGPAGTSIRELLDDDDLALLSEGARHGIFAIRGEGDQCALELTGAYGGKVAGRVSWEDTYSFVRRAAG